MKFGKSIHRHQNVVLAANYVPGPGVLQPTRRFPWHFDGAADPSQNDTPEPSAPVTALGDSAVVLNGRIWIDPRESSAGGTRAAFIEAVKHRFDAEGVGMPYPYTELTGTIGVESLDAPSGAEPADD